MFAEMRLQEAKKYLISQLSAIYSEGESTAISNAVIEYITGKEHPPLLTSFTSLERDKMDQVLKRLLTHEPLQYILEEAWFCGLKFYVDKHVLIPRPETEELVEWIISNCRFPINSLSILDIGSGSGCIPIALKRRIRKADVWGCDISELALEIARQNAAALGTPVQFLNIDFLSPQQRERLPPFDLIVSNPPYIPLSAKTNMDANVAMFEPATALFVPDEDPLVFYKAIAIFGLEKLNQNGSIYLEIHEDLGKEVYSLFSKHEFLVELRKDMQGKDRMVKAWKNP